MMAHDDWDPLSPQQAAELLAGLDVSWWIAGGWAIDLFLGRQTRPHADLDIALLRGTEPALRDRLPTWDIQIAHEGQFIPWDGGPLSRPHHQFWARQDPGSRWAVEFMLEEHRDDVWIYRRDPAVRMPVTRLAHTTDDGFPYLRPEIALLYKAKRASEARNAADFDAALPSLTQEQRRWLRDALTQAHPGNDWIERL